MFDVSDDEFIHRLMNALNEFNACHIKRAEARWGATCFSMFDVSDDEFIHRWSGDDEFIHRRR
jgi:hypothetical protein